MIFAAKLRELREAKGMSQKVLADLAGVKQNSIARYETGEHIPAVDAFQAICRALGVSCTVFDGCTHAEVEAKRGRGRPPKATEPEAAPAKPKAKSKREGKGA